MGTPRNSNAPADCTHPRVDNLGWTFDESRAMIVTILVHVEGSFHAARQRGMRWWLPLVALTLHVVVRVRAPPRRLHCSSTASLRWCSRILAPSPWHSIRRTPPRLRSPRAV